MKLDPSKPTPAQIIEHMLNNQENRPDKLGGGASDAERNEAHEALIRIVQSGGVRFQCVGCDEPMTAAEAAGPCACGGFVCASCVATEEDGVCNHDMHPEIEADLRRRRP